MITDLIPTELIINSRMVEDICWSPLAFKKHISSCPSPSVYSNAAWRDEPEVTTSAYTWEVRTAKPGPWVIMKLLCGLCKRKHHWLRAEPIQTLNFRNLLATGEKEFSLHSCLCRAAHQVHHPLEHRKGTALGKISLSLSLSVCVHACTFVYLFVCGLLKFKETKISHFICFCGMAPGQKPSCSGMLSRALVVKLYSHPVLLFVYVSLFVWFGFCFLDRVYVAQPAFQLRFSCFSTPSAETVPSIPTWRWAYHENVYIASEIEDIPVDLLCNRGHFSGPTVSWRASQWTYNGMGWRASQ